MTTCINMYVSWKIKVNPLWMCFSVIVLSGLLKQHRQSPHAREGTDDRQEFCYTPQVLSKLEESTRSMVWQHNIERPESGSKTKIKVTTQPSNFSPVKFKNCLLRPKQIMLSTVEQVKLREQSSLKQTSSVGAHPSWIHQQVHSQAQLSQSNTETAFQIFRPVCLYSRNPCLGFTSTKLHHIIKEETLISQFFSSSLLCLITLKYRRLIRAK